MSTHNVQEVWQRDFDAIAKMIEDGGHVKKLLDGFEYIDADCPQFLTELHHKLALVGYAQGWLE